MFFLIALISINLLTLSSSDGLVTIDVVKVFFGDSSYDNFYLSAYHVALVSYITILLAIRFFDFKQV